MNVETALDILITAGLGNGQTDVDKVKNRFGALSDEEWKKIWDASELHQIWAVVWAGIKAYGLKETVPEFFRQRFIKAEQAVAYQYYHMLSFTTYVTELLREAGIRFYLLKGIALNALYPKEDMRKLSDADIYIPDMEECRKADRLLREKGFEPEKGNQNFHRGYTKYFFDSPRLLEIHWRPCDILSDINAEKAVRRIYGSLAYCPDTILIAGMDIPVMPSAENALQLLLHMLQHFVREGFGARMLCDWCMYWKHTCADISRNFCKYLVQMELTGFAWTVTQICIEHFGLKDDTVPWMKEIDGSRYKKSTEKMYSDIMAGGEFGKGEKARVLILEGNSSSPVSYIKAVHKMMCARYPKARKIIPAWPFLWTMTVLIFLINNRKMNRGKTLDVIRSARMRSGLMKQMGVFEEKGRKKK